MTRERHSTWASVAVFACIASLLGGLAWPVTLSPHAQDVMAEEPAATDADDNAKVAKFPPRLLGSASCAAAGCHGGLKHANGSGGEYSLWLQRDPHAQGYSVLRNELSREMARKLNLPHPAHEAGVCLNCHSPTTSATLGLVEQAKLSGSKTRGQIVPHRELPPFDGVGCEQCHGPAENWAEEHVRPRWKQYSSGQKAGFGFRDLTDLRQRTQTCVECHVGGPGKDVNHDLIAAGHPRLFFEMASYHANVPPHWDVKQDWRRQYSPNDALGPRPERLDSRLWMLGQVVTAQATAALTHERARHAELGRGPWPELAEWNCFACHHDLNSVSWRQSRNTLASAIAKPAQNAWPFALLEFMPRGTDGEAAIARARELRIALARPAALPRETAQLADAAAKSLGAWATKMTSPSGAADWPQPAEVQAILSQLCGESAELRVARDWDSATQVYLGLSALRDGIRSPAGDSPASAAWNRERDAALMSMATILFFPEGFNSPREFSDDSIQRLQAELRRLRTMLDQSTSKTP